MPNIKSAKKRVLVNETKAARNKAARSALKTDLKKFEAAVAEGKADLIGVGRALLKDSLWAKKAMESL